MRQQTSDASLSTSRVAAPARGAVVQLVRLHAISSAAALATAATTVQRATGWERPPAVSGRGPASDGPFAAPSQTRRPV